MPVIPKCTCLWCGSIMEFERSSKRTCSDACRMAFKRWTAKLGIQNQTAFYYLEAVKLFHGIHPNPNYNKENITNDNTLP